MPKSTTRKRRGLVGRLYHGETNYDLIGNRRRWYLASLVLMAGCIAAMGIMGFNLGIEFAGGNKYSASVVDGVSLSDVEDAVEGTGVDVASGQTAGTGGSERYIIRTAELNDEQSQEVQQAVAEVTGHSPDQVAVSEVSSSWGSSVTRQAVTALLIFLALTVVFLWIRFEHKMAIAALVALLHDLVFAAGIYAIVGFEVTPNTVVGMLTILAYSLYDTVVIFDKVQEDTEHTLTERRQTYAEGANLAVNRTLMRSINTSLISLLPVGGLLFVGVGLLGTGTLKDLALVLFVGITTGTYSSICLATPVLVDLKMRERRYKDHDKKVAAKRSSQARQDAEAAKKAAVTTGESDAADADDSDAESADDDDRVLTGAPRPGARPSGRQRQHKKKRSRSGRRSH